MKAELEDTSRQKTTATLTHVNPMITAQVWVPIVEGLVVVFFGFGFAVVASGGA